jgi:glycosyltransferase involved in cell wall biosynthesis
MTTKSLAEEYRKLNPSFSILYVVPLINYHIRNTDYLYLLYKQILNDPGIKLINLSAAGHYNLTGKGIKNSVLHYHWFEASDIKSLLGIFWKIFWIIIYKLAGGKIVWTVHNRYPHAASFMWLNKPLRRLMAKLADRLHVHCPAATDIMCPVLNVDKNKFFVYPHPFYPAVTEGKAAALKKLSAKYNIACSADIVKTFLVFGQIAPYKGITGIIDTFKKSGKNYRLIIAGTVKKGTEKYYRQVIQKSAEMPCISIISIVIPDEDVPLFFNTADYAVFNYTEVLTSGGVILALSYKKQVIAPAIGCLKEIADPLMKHFNSHAELEKIVSDITRGNDAN